MERLKQRSTASGREDSAGTAMSGTAGRLQQSASHAHEDVAEDSGRDGQLLSQQQQRQQQQQQQQQEEEEGNDKDPYRKKRPSVKRKRPVSLWSVWFGALALCAVWFVLLSQLTVDDAGQNRHRAVDDRFGGSLTLRSNQAKRLAFAVAPRVLHQNLGRVVRPQTRNVPVVRGPTYLPQRSRVLGYYFEDARTNVVAGVERIDPNMIRRVKIRPEPFVGFPDTEEEREALAGLENSRDYKWGLAENIEVNGCKAQYEWQKTSFPTCNLLMEQDLATVDANNDDSHEWPVRFLAHGYWRDVWRVRTDVRDQDIYGGRAVLKTMRYKHDYEGRNYDRHRRDAVTMERLTSSPFIMDIYGFCGNSGLFEFANGGSLDEALWEGDDYGEWKDWSARKRLVVAHQAVSGLAAVHTVGDKGIASIAHTDITTSQFVLVQQAGIYKLNDFNRARFIAVKEDTGEPCPFHVGSNPGYFRSPEEYTPPHVENEKVDVYSLGNVMYCLLTGLWPFDDEKSSVDAQEKIRNGERPPIDAKIFNSEDPYTQTLIRAMTMAWRQDPASRASSTQILHYLNEAMADLDMGEEQK